MRNEETERWNGTQQRATSGFRSAHPSELHDASKSVLGRHGDYSHLKVAACISSWPLTSVINRQCLAVVHQFPYF